jgi:hypothetical protein
MVRAFGLARYERLSSSIAKPSGIPHTDSMNEATKDRVAEISGCTFFIVASSAILLMAYLGMLSR